MLSPLDDYPAHQIAEPMRFVGTSDRNFYDRYYFNLHHCSDELFLTAGLGQYPNLGVADAFVAVTRGQTQHVVRSSRELGADRMDTTVGPISVEVIEGLRRLRLRSATSDAEVELDVVWDGSIPAHAEPHHVNRRGARLTTDTARFSQTGRWSGSLRVGAETFEVTGPQWWGSRDRSWGVRPVGEPEPPGRGQADGSGGFLWLYSTMQFEDFSILYIVQEDRLGERTMEEAVRVWPAATGRRPEPLGRPDHELTFVPGAREVQHARLSCRTPDGTDLVVEVTPLVSSYLALGTGYGMEADWRHGMYQGPLVVQSRDYDLGDPATR
ncbi:MAG TPA: hypothetical protein VKQ71_09775, partial [Acidimicrobiales bacterium]|nr:hypothetical protein [Acidimicrobiales bacterium]